MKKKLLIAVGCAAFAIACAHADKFDDTVKLFREATNIPVAQRLELLKPIIEKNATEDGVVKLCACYMELAGETPESQAFIDSIGQKWIAARKASKEAGNNAWRAPQTIGVVRATPAKKANLPANEPKAKESPKAGARAFEKYMMRVPAELNPKEGIKGVTNYFFAPAAVSIPLKDGNWIYIVNESPKQEGEGGAAQIGVPKKIVELDVISRYLEAMKRFPSITVQIGESTFFAYRCRDMLPPQDGLFLNNCYQGVVASMGSEYSIGLYLPEGRGFDDEVRGILKRVTFVPCPGTAVESALKLYGPGSLLPAAARLPVVKKMVERRGECCELIELLSTLTDDATTKAWCAERLKKLNPGKYATDTRASIPYYDHNDKAQQKAVMEMLGASDGAEKAVVSVPVTARETGTTDATPAKPAPQPVAVAPKPVEDAPKPAEVAPKKPGETAPQPLLPKGSGSVKMKTKTVTLPGGATMEMIYCPPGTYMMGRRKDSPCQDSHDVCPPIKVTLTKGFWLGKYEVTQAQWKSVMGKNPSDEESLGDDLPVNNMSWDDAVAFVKKVGNGARLPTDAEWEYACKAGTDTVFHWGDTCNGTEANCNGTKPFGTEKKGPNIGHAVKVGSYPPNAWGFYDMAGNVAEWCNDRHKDYFIVHPEELTDPKGGDSTVRHRTVRGGCFYAYWQAIACRSVKRDMLPPDWPKAYVGFRMAMNETAESTMQESTMQESAQTGARSSSTAADATKRVPPGEGSASSGPGNKTKTITLPGGEKMEMVWCPPGTYTMGTPDDEPDRQSKETLHKVTLTKGFWLGKYEVTQAQWESVMGKNPSKNKNAELPVESVTWEDCDAFCKKVGGGARFPTEAEWEYACRAGTKTAFYWGMSLNGDKANCKGEYPSGTKEKGPFVGHMTKGGTYGENPWGFCDMSGNVEEWCSDFYDLIKADTDSAPAVDPKGPDTGDFRIVRGGHWRDMAKSCRSGCRGYGHQKAPNDIRGFRMAMDE